ncbi:MAG TPA: helix-turn-helix transcriptional regulator [Opitutaceae bacterium]|nr:helix-turn-helix transcriptional regulator [Opitutaceae bacterium]
MRHFSRINAKATGAACRVAFKHAKMSQTELANKVGLNQGRISRLLKGKFTELTPKLEQACRILGVTPIAYRQSFNSEEHPEIVAALESLLDGSQHRARNVLKLLRTARNLSH